jgi:hypothetical protein
VLILASQPAGPTNKTSLDGSAVFTSAGGATTSTITLSTTKAGDYIVVAAQANSAFPTTSGVSDVAGLSWTLLARDAPINGSSVLYGAYSPGILTSDVITITYNTTPSFVSTVAFGINGVPATSQIDPNGALPGVTATSTPFTLTTSNANDFLIAFYSMTSATNTAGSGWTLISGANFSVVEYQIVTATQSALSATVGSGTIKNGVGTAVVSQ